MIQSYDDSGENFREYRGYRLDRIYPQAMWKITKDSKPIKELPSLYTTLRIALSDIDAHIVFSEKTSLLKAKNLNLL